MTGIENDIICQFKDLVSKHELPLIEQEIIRGGRKHFYYSVYSNPIVIQFISNLTKSNSSLINQYIFANSFLALIQGLENLDVYINLVYNGDCLSFEFSLFEIFDHDYYYFLTLYSQCKKQNSNLNLSFEMAYSLMVYTNDYEVAYNEILSDIKKALNSNVKTFKHFFEINKMSNVNFINSRLINTDLKIVSLTDFIKRYQVDDSSIFINCMNLGQHTVTVDLKTFNSFLKDSFSESFAKKLKNIVALTSFQETFFKRDIKWIECVSNHFSITFNKTSKYAELNQFYQFHFGVNLNLDCRESILLFDDGTIEFYDPINQIVLTDLDSIYDHLKENLILRLEKTFQMHRDDFRLPDLKIHEMLIL